ncbi:MAG TPA: ATP-binding protein, partial [Verrucomicrobiae bacterium]|nr:ATP-binding protein [Verrucomicrobiae bacterium]
LDFSRIEAGRLKAIFEPVDLATFTADLASVFRGATDRAGLKLTVECPSLSEPVYVDRSMWEKIVLNLVSNAFKFTLDGEIRVTLACTRREVELRVQDTGVGVPADEIPRLFERFHRVENTRGRTHEGSGIGLALVQELVKIHGGSVRAESCLGSGSTFIITIPLGKDHLPTDRIGGGSPSRNDTAAAAFVEEALRWLPEQKPGESSESFFNRELPPISFESIESATTRARVLVADDNADMRQYVARLLSKHYNVETVSDGRAALTVARMLPPDLILSDVMMPHLDGIGLVHELRADESLKTIPIILLSARTGEESQVEGLQQGADDYIAKPFSAAELLARVESHLSLARLRREAAEKIRQSEDRFRALVTASSEVVYRMNPDWSEMKFLRGREFLADTEEPDLTWLQKYIPRDDHPVIMAAIQEAIRRKAMFHLEHRVLRRDGTVGWTLSRAVPLLDGRGEITEWFGAAVDITERKMTEQALRDSEQRLEKTVAERTAKLQELVGELEHFSYSITHDMRAPLRAMRGFAEVLNERGTQTTPDEQKLYLDRIITAAERMDGLIADALHYSKAVRQELSLGPVDVGRLLRGMLDSYPEFQSSKAEIEISGEIPLVLGNEAGLTQCMSNLIGNAVKFVEPNACAKVRVRAETSGDLVRIWVEDEGIGISPSMLPRVFDMFSRGAVPQAGTGIGLALVRTVVQRMGGRVGVESRLREGSRFWIELRKAN